MYTQSPKKETNNYFKLFKWGIYKTLFDMNMDINI